MEMDTHPWPYAAKPSEHPCASKLARSQARRGNRVTSLRHISVDLDEQNGSRLLVLLDGTKDRQALADQSGLNVQTIDAYLDKFSKLSLLIS
jgi:hypothetical protein